LAKTIGRQRRSKQTESEMNGKSHVNGSALNGFKSDSHSADHDDEVAEHDEDSDDGDEQEEEFDDAERRVVGEDEEERAPTGSTTDNTDDPVRMYLMQMGQIPLLARAQEISAAKDIEFTRRRYRHSMLATDYVLQGAVGLLEQVRDGKLRLDRTIEVSVTNTGEKKRIMLRIVPNVTTLRRLLLENHRDYHIAVSTRVPDNQRRLETTGDPPQQGRSAGGRTESADQPAATVVRQSRGNRSPHADAQAANAGSIDGGLFTRPDT
jgi:hypothetical protein